MSTFPEFTAKGRVVFCTPKDASMRFPFCVVNEDIYNPPEDKETPAQMVARALHNLYHPENMR